MGFARIPLIHGFSGLLAKSTTVDAAIIWSGPGKVDYDFDDTDERVNADEALIDDDATYVCNSCGEEIVVPLDFSQGASQEYVEDCPVCCNPNVIFVEIDPDGVANIWSRAEQDPSG